MWVNWSFLNLGQSNLIIALGTAAAERCKSFLKPNARSSYKIVKTEDFIEAVGVNTQNYCRQS